MLTLSGKYCMRQWVVVQISPLRKLTKHSLIQLAWKTHVVSHICSLKAVVR